MDDNSHYYVYVYIDPRNLEEFYYGKGKGNRKEAHLFEDSDNEKSKRIKDIRKAGQEPTIKVIARNLTDKQALLVEKTLIWKLGRTLTNKSPGHFGINFRPHNTLHLDLSGFDFKNGIYNINIGEGIHRCWDDCKKFNFLAAGQDKKWSDPLRTLEVGDIVCAYLKNHGWVGIGQVTENPVCVSDFRHSGKSLRELPLKAPNIFDNQDNDKAEYLVKVKWLKSVDGNQAKWKKNSGLFSSQLIKASLQGQPDTIKFLEKEFAINLTDVLLTNEKR